MPLRYNAFSSSLTVNAQTAGTVLAGTSVMLGDTSRPKVAHLQALATMVIVTGSLTYAGKWQVSNDNATWVDVANDTQNAAAVTVTATATKSYPAPAGVYGWRYCRFAITTGGATGGASDTLSIGYCLRTA